MIIDGEGRARSSATGEVSLISCGAVKSHLENMLRKRAAETPMDNEGGMEVGCLLVLRHYLGDAEISSEGWALQIAAAEDDMVDAAGRAGEDESTAYAQIAVNIRATALQVMQELYPEDTNSYVWASLQEALDTIDEARLSLQASPALERAA